MADASDHQHKIFRDLRDIIASWPGVEVRSSEERGLQFCAGRGEFLHFHGSRQVDIRLSLPDRDLALNSPLVRFHPRGHEGGWVIVPLQPGCLELILDLAQKAYQNRGRHE